MIISGDSISPTSGSNITIGGTNIVVPSGVGINVSGNRIGTIGSDYGAFKGNVVQCRVTRYDVRTSVTTGTSASGVEITGLRVSITPKFINSMMLCNFFIFGEGSTHNIMYIVYKNGTVPIGEYAGYNKESGLVNFSGMASTGDYDAGDYNSTPHNTMFPYHDFPNTLSTITYGVGIKSSDSGNNSYFINRTVGSPQTSYECGVSFATVWEIAQ